MLDAGIYFVVREAGTIVAAAGTHVMSCRWSVAAVGNVFTEPSHRGQGLGTIATSAVVAALFEEVDTVILNVAVANRAAVRVYEKLGFGHIERLYEAIATARVQGPRRT